MAWKCPQCIEEIEHLQYNVSTSGSEYGSASLNDRPRPASDPNRNYEIIDSHDDEGTEDKEWADDPTYECPECNAEINKDNLIWFDPDKDEENEIKEDILEETLHKIITPKKNIINKEKKESTDCSFICYNKKCLKVFVAEVNNIHMYGEFFIECPKCGTVNSSETYKKLLSEGYFNEKIHDKPRKKKQIRHRSISTLGYRPTMSKIPNKVSRSIRRKSTIASKKN